MHLYCMCIQHSTTTICCSQHRMIFAQRTLLPPGHAGSSLVHLAVGSVYQLLQSEAQTKYSVLHITPATFQNINFP